MFKETVYLKTFRKFYSRVAQITTVLADYIFDSSSMASTNIDHTHRKIHQGLSFITYTEIEDLPAGNSKWLGITVNSKPAHINLSYIHFLSEKIKVTIYENIYYDVEQVNGITSFNMNRDLLKKGEVEELNTVNNIGFIDAPNTSAEGVNKLYSYNLRTLEEGPGVKIAIPPVFREGSQEIILATDTQYAFQFYNNGSSSIDLIDLMINWYE